MELEVKLQSCKAAKLQRLDDELGKQRYSAGWLAGWGAFQLFWGWVKDDPGKDT